MIRTIIFALALAFATSATPSHAIDKATSLEIQRLDQRLNRLEQDKNLLMKDMRQMQRENDEIKKQNAAITGKMAALEDRFLKLENVDLANIKAVQDQTIEKTEAGWYKVERMIEDDRAALRASMTDLDWGSKTRDCAGIGKHQQIQNTTSPDGSRTVRHLCYDGRLIHLETSLNNPPL